MPSFFGTSQLDPIANYLFLLGAIVLVIGIILTAHGIVVK